MKLFASLALAALSALPTPTIAETVSSSDTHYVLRHEASSTRTAGELWQRLIRPETWWHPDHTYSGDSGNLSLDARAGGLWLESWDGGSVAHGTVLFVRDGSVLRMNAPFGPLQALGAHTIWTITISPDGNGSRVVFDEVSNGPPTADMTTLAEAVDFVKNEAIGRLVGP